MKIYLFVLKNLRLLGLIVVASVADRESGWFLLKGHNTCVVKWIIYCSENAIFVEVIYLRFFLEVERIHEYNLEASCLV